MAVQAYPDLMEPWGLTIVPARGLPFGEGLILHGGEYHPRLAESLGFRLSELGYVFEPDESDTGFTRAIAGIGMAVAALMPTAGFVFVDPMALVWEVRAPSDDLWTSTAQRHRFAIRAAIAQAPPAPPSAVWRVDEGAAPDMSGELLAVMANAVNFTSRMPGSMIGLPYGVQLRPGIYAYAQRDRDGVRLGVFARRSRVAEPSGLILRAVSDRDDGTLYSIAGRGAIDMLYDASVAGHLLGTALARMSVELYASTTGMTARYVGQYGTLHEEAFPNWAVQGAEATDECQAEPAPPSR